jgi:hypothetical protein
MIRSLVLFTHVAAVIALFVGLVLEWFALYAVGRATTREEGITWVRLNLALQRVLGIAFGATLLSGFYLGSRMGVLGSGWMLASYAAILLIGASGGVMARRLTRTLRVALQNPNDLTFTAVQASVSAWAPRLTLRIRVALALAIVYLMIGKPGIGISLAIIATALVLALLLASLQKGPAPSPFVEGYR